MKKMAFLLLFLILTGMISGCGSAKMASSPSAPEYAKTESSTQDSAGSMGSGNVANAAEMELDAIEKKIIKNAEINITVKDSIEAETEVQDLVVKYQGFVQNASSYSSKNNSGTDMEVRIPADKFESFINELKNIGDVTHNRVYTTDVTEEFIDLSARQKTLKLQEERLQEMLKKAKDVDELLKVENELARVRGEIERITGRLKYLENKTSYSTITVHLSTKYIPSEAEIKDFGDQVIYSFKNGFGSFLNLILAIIKATAWLLPFSPVLIPIGYVVYLRYRKRRPDK